MISVRIAENKRGSEVRVRKKFGESISEPLERFVARRPTQNYQCKDEL